MTEAKLLPCPFCGSKAEPKPGSGKLMPTLEESLQQQPTIRCSNGQCGARYVPGGFPIEEWNRRALSQPSAGGRDYCESCGYTDSHDPNCPRPQSSVAGEGMPEEPDLRNIENTAAALVLMRDYQAKLRAYALSLREKREGYVMVPREATMHVRIARVKGGVALQYAEPDYGAERARGRYACYLLPAAPSAGREGKT